MKSLRIGKIKQAYVLDACALLRLAQDEPGAERVAEILNRAARSEIVVMMHQINLGEVIYRIGKKYGWPIAERKRGEISLLPIEIVAFSDEVFWEAVKLKACHAMSYADCFAAALAYCRQATLVTSDPEFDVLGENLPRISV